MVGLKRKGAKVMPARLYQRNHNDNKVCTINHIATCPEINCFGMLFWRVPPRGVGCRTRAGANSIESPVVESREGGKKQRLDLSLRWQIYRRVF